MSLKEKLQSDLLESMRSKDVGRLSTLRLLKASIQNAEIAKGQPLEDADILVVLSREVRQRRESISEFRKGDRADLVEKEEAELAIILEYMPQQMSRDEIIAVARGVISEVGAQGPSDMGKVMGKLMPQLKGKVDGKEVSSAVGELLRSSS